MIFGVHGWSLQSSSLIKLRVKNRVSTVCLDEGEKRGVEEMQGMRVV